jgi:uncharacterized protein YycO
VKILKKALFLGKGFALCALILLLATTLFPTGGCINLKPKPQSVTDTANDSKAAETMSVPEGVKIGDLILCDIRVDQANPWKRPGLFNEHCAIYIGNDTLIEANGVVRYRNFTQFSHWCRNYVFLRVKTANESQRLAAAEWAKSKIGTAYQVFFDFPWFGLKIANTNRKFPTANILYCAELCWASYYNQGIDIDQNGWAFPIWVTPNDILHDDNVEIIYKDVTNTTEIIQPDKGVYLANKKIAVTVFNTVVIGPINIEVTTENENITSVDFYIDTVYKATDTTVPYSWSWIERGSGKKVITVVARQDDGNHYSSKISVWKFF